MNQPQTHNRLEQRKQFIAALSETNEPAQIIDRAINGATQCPRCKQKELKTLEVRQCNHGSRRRKQCANCKARLTTQEIDQTLYEEMKDALETLTKIKQLMEPAKDKDAA